MWFESRKIKFKRCNFHGNLRTTAVLLIICHSVCALIKTLVNVSAGIRLNRCMANTFGRAIENVMIWHTVLLLDVIQELDALLSMLNRTAHSFTFQRNTRLMNILRWERNKNREKSSEFRFEWNFQQFIVTSVQHNDLSKLIKVWSVVSARPEDLCFCIGTKQGICNRPISKSRNQHRNEQHTATTTETYYRCWCSVHYSPVFGTFVSVLVSVVRRFAFRHH